MGDWAPIWQQPANADRAWAALRRRLAPAGSLSLLVVTYNEAARIESFLRALAPLVDEVVLVDQSSTDATRDIAARVLRELAGPRATRRARRPILISDEHRGYCEASRGLGAALQTCRWTLVLDADETLSARGSQELRPLIAAATRQGWDGYRLRRETSVDGEVFERPDDVHFRLFRAGRAHYLDILHSAPVPTREQRVGPTPAFVCIEHHKTLQEELADELRYEQVIAAKDESAEWKAERLAWNVYLSAQRTGTPAAEIERHRRATQQIQRG